MPLWLLVGQLNSLLLETHNNLSFEHVFARIAHRTPG
jgi:hypothetical protein